MKLQIDNLGKVAITVEEQPWSINKAYDRLTIVENNFTSYISRIAVPKGQPLEDNRKYWIPFGTRNGSISVSSFKLIGSESQLPTVEEENDGPYLIGTIAYFWVGSNGNAVDGKYQSINLQGPAGSAGPAGPQGDPGTDGVDGITPHIGSDGYWYIGTERTNYPATGPQGPQGTPGTNGRDGKDGKDGKDGANGSNGKDGEDGEDGYTPYIGANGNWFINGQDTGKPSRGPQGIPGTGGDGTNVYIDEERKRIVFVVDVPNAAETQPQLFTPPANGTILTIKSPSTYVEIQVHGINLTDSVILESNDTTKFTLKYGDSEPAGTVEVPKEAANSDDIAYVRIIPNPGAGTVMGFNGSVSVYSKVDEFDPRYISIRYVNSALPGSGGMVGPGQGTIDSEDNDNINIAN